MSQKFILKLRIGDPAAEGPFLRKTVAVPSPLESFKFTDFAAELRSLHPGINLDTLSYRDADNDVCRIRYGNSADLLEAIRPLAKPNYTDTALQCLRLYAAADDENTTGDSEHGNAVKCDQRNVIVERNHKHSKTGNASSLDKGVPRRKDLGITADAVLIIYNLANQMNCDRLFNLLCLYGNVWKVRFLYAEPSTAMVQMEDPRDVARVAKHLNGVKLFGNTLQICASKQPFLSDGRQGAKDRDGWPMFQDFTNTPNNRYPLKRNEAGWYGSCVETPTKTLYFYNAPPFITRELMSEVFKSTKPQAPAPVGFKLFPSCFASPITHVGMIEFSNEEEAMHAVVLANNAALENPQGPYPYVLKFNFAEGFNPPSSTRRRARPGARSAGRPFDVCEKSGSGAVAALPTQANVLLADRGAHAGNARSAGSSESDGALQPGHRRDSGDCALLQLAAAAAGIAVAKTD